MTIEISICMITYNKAPFLEIAVPKIFKQIRDYDKFEFLLLDNGSNDGTAGTIDKLVDEYPITRFRSEVNVGLNGYAMIADQAQGEMIVTADDDIFYLSPMWDEYFSRIFSTTFDGRSFGYIGADTINEDGGRMGEIAGIAKVDEIEIEVGTVGGWFSATRRDIMEEIGGFHRDMPEMYLEDADFQNRAWRHGYLCGTVRNVRVYHARAPRHYRELGCEEAYLEKARLASEAGLKLEPLT